MIDISVTIHDMLSQFGSIDIAESEFKRQINEDDNLKAAFKEWCEEMGYKERDAFLHGTGAYSIWTYYANEPDEIKAYRITVTGRENGRVVGRVIPLNYREQVRRVQRHALIASTMTIQYESGHTITVPYQENPHQIATILPGHGGIRRIRYAPENEAELARIIMEEHRWQTGKIKKGSPKRHSHPGR